MTQLAFNLTESLRRRDHGLALVELSNREKLDYIRTYCRAVSKARGWAHIDDARAFAARNDLELPSQVWGAVFKSKGWKQTGERRPSALVTNHGHQSPCWKYEGTPDR